MIASCYLNRRRSCPASAGNGESVHPLKQRSEHMKKQRKHCTAEEKVAILRRYRVEGVPISDLCDKRGLQPTVFYRWQTEFFEDGAPASTAAFRFKDLL